MLEEGECPQWVICPENSKTQTEFKGGGALFSFLYSFSEVIYLLSKNRSFFICQFSSYYFSLHRPDASEGFCLFFFLLCWVRWIGLCVSKRAKSYYFLYRDIIPHPFTVGAGRNNFSGQSFKQGDYRHVSFPLKGAPTKGEV